MTEFLIAPDISIPRYRIQINVFVKSIWFQRSRL